jgi:hypothetical protein
MSLPLIVDIAKSMATNRSSSKKEEYTIARKYVDDGLATLRNDYRVQGLASPVAQAIDELSRVPKVDRKYALLQFRKLNRGREPDVTDVVDLQMLIQLSEDVYK